MRTSALDLLACPRCHGGLALLQGEAEPDGHILEGALGCAGCQARFPVRRGIPRLLPEALAAEAESTARRFAEQWEQFDHVAGYHARQLLDWLAPLTPGDFAGRRVLEAGCGKGRHTLAVADWAPRALVALDLGDAVEVAFPLTRHLEGVHVVQGDLAAPPVRRVFDLAFSVGVLHHTPDPGLGFRRLADTVRSGGRVAIWVYAREGNWFLPVLQAARRVTTRLPRGLLLALTLGPSLAIWLAARFLYRGGGSWLPYGAYLSYVGGFPPAEIHNIVYDQLTPTLAFYLPRNEVEGWFEPGRFQDRVLSWHNRNSWRATALVGPQEAAGTAPPLA